ncbi:aa3-type cytochrome c oxidase subunit IV [Thalassospira australica]
MQGKDYELTDTHVTIYNGYTTFMKWGTLSVIGLLIVMAAFLI